MICITRYYSGDQIKTYEMGGARSTMGERRDAYRILIGKPEGNRFCITGYLVPDILMKGTRVP